METQADNLNGIQRHLHLQFCFLLEDFFPLRAHVPTLGFARCHLNPHVCDSLIKSVGSFLGWECQNKSVNKHLLRTWLLWELAGEMTDQELTLKEHIIYQGIQLSVNPQRSRSRIQQKHKDRT